MKERPILFNGDMVRAILDGRKTQTRRPIKQQPPSWWSPYRYYTLNAPDELWCGDVNGRLSFKSPFGQSGDRLWVRESFVTDGDGQILYCIGSGAEVPTGWSYRGRREGASVPSIHMPRWASRITLEVVRVWVDRIHDISAADVLAEGIDLPIPQNCNPSNPPKEFNKWSEDKQDKWINGHARTVYFARCADMQNHIDTYKTLWDSIYAKRGFGWDTNPWVWACEFNRVEGESK